MHVVNLGPPGIEMTDGERPSPILGDFRFHMENDAGIFRFHIEPWEPPVAKYFFWLIIITIFHQARTLVPRDDKRKEAVPKSGRFSLIRNNKTPRLDIALASMEHSKCPGTPPPSSDNGAGQQLDNFVVLIITRESPQDIGHAFGPG